MCLESRGCDGSSQAWRSCVLSSCPQPNLSLRDEQCAAFNSQQGHRWVGTEQPQSPCSLDCQAQDDPEVVERFNNKVQDGTRCGQTGLNVCLEGQCEVSSSRSSAVVVVVVVPSSSGSCSSSSSSIV